MPSGSKRHVFFPGKVLTPEEAKQEYENTKRFVNENGRFPGEDMPFVSADFKFALSYRPVFLPFQLKENYRMLGKSNQNGDFVWENVPLDKKIEKVRWIDPPTGH